MGTDTEFHVEMLDLYWRTGRETRYWANRYLASVRKDGGLVVAKKLLARKGVATGLNRLVELDRLDLSVEALVLDDRFAHLFSRDELDEARERLDGMRSMREKEYAGKE